MANGRLDLVVRHIQEFAGAWPPDELTDGQLLEWLAGSQREAAFTALVRRHGPLVLGVCRRLLPNVHDAEDAFQATFLVLFRRARALDRRGSLAGWLYTVAYHAALKARARAARRRRLEKQVQKLARAESAPEETWHDLQPVLDEELSCLPEKYRIPVVLCYLQGKTQEEAARLLGRPVGTIKSRLARAREQLRTRLLRRGVTLSAGLLSTLLAEKARAALPAFLLQRTVQTALPWAAGETAGLATAPAATIADGVLRTLLAAKLRAPLALLAVVGALALSAGSLLHAARGQRPADPLAQAGPRTVLTRDLPPERHPKLPGQEARGRMTVAGRVFSPDGKPLVVTARNTASPRALS